MIYKLLASTDPELTMEPEKFDFDNPQMDPIELARALAETMIHNNGLGLAANQIGFPYKVFAMNGNPIHVCFNPIIVDQSKQMVELEEGCLSFPNVVVKVKSPMRIKVRYTQADGEVKTEVFEGMTAKIFCHEYQHTLGQTMKDSVTKLQWDRAVKKAKKHSSSIIMPTREIVIP